MAFPFFLRFRDNPDEALTQLIGACVQMNKNALSAVCAIAAGCVFHRLMHGEQQSQSQVLQSAVQDMDRGIEFLKRNYSSEFDLLSLNGLEKIPALVKNCGWPPRAAGGIRLIN